MTTVKTLYQTYQRFRTLQTHEIRALPIVILMPHSACNCRCVMCDIWKDNKNLRQLNESDLTDLLHAFKKYGTRQVLMSGGEALLHPKFFRFCEILKGHHISVSLLSTGLTLGTHAEKLVENTNEIIISLDGTEPTHNHIRNIPNAFGKLSEGIRTIKDLKPGFPISARTVIQRLNFREWPAIIEAAINLGLDRISFLPADVSSHAFNREVLWSDQRQQDVLPDESDLTVLKDITEDIIINYRSLIENGFIAEQPDKLRKIYQYYSAAYGHGPFPYKRCNAPWVSAVIEADGTVRPCFFHEAMGNIHDKPLEKILNSEESISFRKNLDMDNNPTCIKCVCYLHLSPGQKLN